MKKIISISEAFSMQPKTLTVEKERSPFNGNYSCKKIVLKCYKMSNGEDIDYYIGYNFENKKIFQYRAISVNVHYGE